MKIGILRRRKKSLTAKFNTRMLDGVRRERLLKKKTELFGNEYFTAIYNSSTYLKNMKMTRKFPVNPTIMIIMYKIARK